MKTQNSIQHAVFAVLAALLTMTCAPAQQREAPSAAIGGSSMQNASLVDFIDVLAKQLNIQYTVDPAVKDSVILSAYPRMSHQDARTLFDLILRINGVSLVQEGDHYRIVPTKAPPPIKTTSAAGAMIGKDMGGGFHGCIAGDNSPDGTVKDGLKKVMTQTPFGSSCHWEPAQ